MDKEPDYEEITGGSDLMREIYTSTKGPWLIIHGHKHFADINYAPCPGKSAPVIFSAGSFSARLYTKIEDRTSNQFYTLDVDLERSRTEGSAIGTFETHECIAGAKWGFSCSKNLPATGGFGSSENPTKIAHKIKKKLDNNLPFLDKGELEEFNKETANFTPTDFNLLKSTLLEFDLSITTENNSIIEVGLKND